MPNVTLPLVRRLSCNTPIGRKTAMPYLGGYLMACFMLDMLALIFV